MTQSTILLRSRDEIQFCCMNLAEVITFVKFVLPWTLPVKEPEGSENFSVARRFLLCRYVEFGSSGHQFRVNVKFFGWRQISSLKRFHFRQVQVHVLCMSKCTYYVCSSYCKYNDINRNIKIYSGRKVTYAI